MSRFYPSNVLYWNLKSKINQGEEGQPFFSELMRTIDLEFFDRALCEHLEEDRYDLLTFDPYTTDVLFNQMLGDFNLSNKACLSIHRGRKQLHEDIIKANSELTKSDWEPQNYLQNYREMRCFSLCDAVTFGRRKGQTLKELIYQDPGYFEWLVHNVKWFCPPRQIIDNMDSACPGHRFLLKTKKIAEAKYTCIERQEVNEWKKSQQYHNKSRESSFKAPSDSRFYNDNLDMDQQSVEFWRDLGW